jgi:drug/metabolite transporter (DMT)-like permease
MKLILLTIFALICFAANSLICRAALKTGAIDAGSFTFIRLFSGAIFLIFFLKFIKKVKLSGSIDKISVMALLGYAIFFSLSYIRIDAGIGAFLLFGSVQVTMIGWGLIKKTVLNSVEIIGLLIALIGLGLFSVPGKTAPALSSSVLMIFAGISWGVYSIRGKSVQDPLKSTAKNFLLSVPFVIVFPLLTYKSIHITSEGVLLATLSGAITSGIGYTIWYSVVPKLGITRAAVVQLSVPVLALIAAIPLLGESPAQMTILAGLLILSGIVINLMGRK